MKFIEPSHFTDPDAAARKLVEIANASEAVQDGRIYIELINSPFLKEGGTPDQYRAALARAVTLGWLWLHESGTHLPVQSCSPDGGQPADRIRKGYFCKMQDLQEMAEKLLEAARRLPPGSTRHEMLKEIGRFRARINALLNPKPRRLQNKAASVEAE